jgi:hypothetical protein
MNDLLNYLEPFEPPRRIDGRGGARQGAGRPPKDSEPTPEKHDFDVAKARHETIKADLAEIDLKLKRRQYLSRDAYVQASSTIISAFAQSARTIQDRLEREGIPVPVCQKVGEILDSMMEQLSKDFEVLNGPDPDL